MRTPLIWHLTSIILSIENHMIGTDCLNVTAPLMTQLLLLVKKNMLSD